MGEYDVGQVCLNGHSANPYFRTMPEFNKEYCPDCGERTITVCPECGKAIQGRYIRSGAIGSKYHPPAYCKFCGSPFPWTSRAIQAAINLADIELDEQEDKDIFNQNVRELTKDAPQTKVAAARMKKILAKAGTAFGESIREILIDIASETAKKALWG